MLCWDVRIIFGVFQPIINSIHPGTTLFTMDKLILVHCYGNIVHQARKWPSPRAIADNMFISESVSCTHIFSLSAARNWYAPSFALEAPHVCIRK